MKNRLFDIFKAKDRIPAILPLSYPGLQLMDYSIKEVMFDAEKQCDVMEALVKEFDLDVIFNFIDLSMEPEMLGAKIKFEENIKPSVLEHPIKTLEDIENIKIPDPKTDERMSIFVECMKMMNERIDMPKLAATNGPFTIAGELMDVAESLKATIKNKEFLKKLLDKTAETLNKYIEAFVDAGADIVAICEPSGSMLSGPQFWEFSGKYIHEIFASNSKAIPLLHICGNTTYILPEMAKTGAAGLSLDTAVDLQQAAEIVPDDIAVIGNIDPVRTMYQADASEVKEKVIELKEKMSGNKNFVASTGCDLPHTIPLENIHAFIEGLKN